MPSPFRGDPYEALRSPDRSRLDRRRGARCEPSAGTGAKPNGAGDGNETRSHHRRPGHAQGDTRKAERVAGETRRLSQTGAATENPIAEAACLRASLHVAVTSGIRAYYARAPEPFPVPAAAKTLVICRT